MQNLIGEAHVCDIFLGNRRTTSIYHIHVFLTTVSSKCPLARCVLLGHISQMRFNLACRL